MFEVMEMGYRIDYGPGPRRRVSPMVAGWFLLFLLLVGAFWPKGREVLGDVLFPGDWAVTTAAMEDFARTLRSGEELGVAVEGFCRTILKGEPLDPG